MSALARIRAALKTASNDEMRAELVHTAFEIAEREGFPRAGGRALCR